MIVDRRGMVLLAMLASGCHRAVAAGSSASGPRPPPTADGMGAASPQPTSPPSLAASAPSSATAAPTAADPSDGEAASDPFGVPATFARYTCPDLRRGGPFHAFLANADTRVAFVDGDDWLALVNRSPTGALSPDYAPSDLVDIKTGKPHPASECGAQRECLRKDTADALRGMLDAMREGGVEGHVQSAFRAFGTQCWVFESWAHQARGGFCEATEQSALPGHSQHQLGTTLDLFTKAWADEGARTGQGVFRSGFGCSPGGKWIDEHAWRFGFVVPYPIHPDDRRDSSRCEARTDRPVPIDPKTGYMSEPWHVRFIGTAAAARYHEAWLASRPDSPDEITLEQWIRAQRGLAGDTELPVCDGCQCGACATLADDDAQTPCRQASLWLGADGRVARPADDPRLVDVRIASRDAEPPAARARGSNGPAKREAARPSPSSERDPSTLTLEVALHTPAHTPTQPPVVGRDGPTFGGGATYLSLEPYAGTRTHRYPDLPNAWRIGVEPVLTHPDLHAPKWPWRASLAAPDLEPIWNRANVLLPSKAGDVTLRIAVVVPGGAQALRVTLLRDGVEHETREIPLAPADAR